MADEIVDRLENTPVPGGYALPGNIGMAVASVRAQWDGSGAGGSFLACCSVFSQNGSLIGRFFPSQQFAAGDTGEVTYGPF